MFQMVLATLALSELNQICVLFPPNQLLQHSISRTITKIWLLTSYVRLKS